MRNFYLSSILNELTFRVSLVFAFCLFLFGTSFGTIYNVPFDALTINGAISLATAGDTITVDAGVYVENVVVDEEVVLLGANAGVACDGVRGAESVIIGSGGAAISVDVENVEINGFTISNPTGNYGIYADGVGNLAVVYNIITDVGDNISGSGSTFGFIIEMNSSADISNVNVSRNCVNNIRGGEDITLVGAAAKSNNGSAFGIGAGFSDADFDISNLTITENIITNITADTADFADGGKGAYGAFINIGAITGSGKAISPVINANEITNLEGLWAHGIGLEGETPGATVTNNYIDDLTDHKNGTDAFGVLIEDNDGAATLSVNFNSFTNMAFSVGNRMAANVDATCNWHGYAGPGLDTLHDGNITYLPALVNGTDDDPSATGFQPVAGSCSALSASCEDDTIQCATSTNGQVTASGVSGLPPYTYQWDASTGNQTTATATGLGVGTYSVTVTDNLGATATCSSTVTNIDNTFPFTSCINHTAVGLDPVTGTVTVPASFIDNGSFDNCGIVTIFLDDSVFTCADIGIQPVELTVRDAAGNENYCTTQLEIQDKANPKMKCRDANLKLDGTGNAMLLASMVDNGSTDACGIDTLIVSPNKFTCADDTVKVILTGTDVNGNSDTCHAKVTVMDNLAPDALCQDITTYLDSLGSSPSDLESLVDNGSTDNCGIATYLLDQRSFDCSDIGENSVVLTVTDSSGNSDTCHASVEVADTSAPIAVCNDTTVYIDTNGNASVTAAMIDGGSTDNCGVASLSASPDAFTCSDAGPNAVTLTVTDVNGNTSSCTATVTVEDNERPTAVCNDAMVILDGSGNGSLTAVSLDGGSTDNCGVVSYSASQTSFSCADVVKTTAFTTTVSAGTQAWTGPLANDFNVIDPSGVLITELGAFDHNQDGIKGAPNGYIRVALYDLNASAIVAGADVNIAGSGDPLSGGYRMRSISPILVPPGNYTVIAQGFNVNELNGNVSSGSPLANFNGGVVLAVGDSSRWGNTTFTSIPNRIAPSGFFLAGTFSYKTNTVDVDLVVGDAAGNLDTCTSTVTVKDTITPTAVCQDITVQLDANGGVVVSPSAVDGGSSDNCSLSMALDSNAYTCSDLGEHDVVLSVYDACGNTDTCHATITVEDNVAPDAQCQDITVQLDATGNVSITTGDIDNGSSDACGIDTMTLDISSFGCTDVGTNTVELTVTDVNGNSASCNSTVTVEDSVAPEANCNKHTIYLDNNGEAELKATDVDAGSSDACGVASLSVDSTDFDCSETGENPVVLTVTDVNGNTDTCHTSVLVLDTLPPSAACQDITLYLDGSGSATTSASAANAGSTDNCGSPLIFSLKTTTYGCSDIGNNENTLYVTDGSGNVDSCSFTVTIVDTLDPVVACQDISVWLDEDGIALVDPADVNNGSTDACALTLTLDRDSFTCADIGTMPIVLMATDSSGNTTSDTCSITISDTTSPDAQCQDITVPLNGSGNAIITASSIDDGSSDACGILDLSIDQTSFTCADTGDNTVTLTVTDVNGNVDSCTSTVTLVDDEAPTPICAFGISVGLNGSGTAFIPAAVVNNNSYDNCGICSITLSPQNFTCADIGPNTVFLTVEDCSGNKAMCTTNIQVQDKFPPKAICQNTSVQLDSSGNASMSATDIDGGSSDACGIVTYSASQTTFDCSDLGGNSVVLTVMDAHGNSDTCHATVTVEDTLSPNAVCTDTSVELDGSGNASVSGAMIDGGSTDNCGVATLSPSPASFTCADTGSNTVTLTVMDAAGNSSTCMATVTVNDNLAPIAVCSDITVELDSSGNASVSGAMIDGGSTDNCGIDSLSASPSSFTCADTGDNTVTLTVTDAAGNSSTCDATVTIEDNISPTAVCSDITISLDSSGNATVSGSQIDGGSNDNCGVVSLSASPSTFTCADTGDNTVTLTVTDAAGNSSTCTADVTVVDDIAPTAVCTDISVTLDSMGNASITEAMLDGGSSDNCGVDSLSASTTLDCADVPSTTVTLTVTDAAGNSSTCDATVTVNDTTDPVAVCKDITVSLNATGTVEISASQIDDGSSDACGVNLPECGSMVIAGTIDGPLTGGIPKAVELYVINDIPDLSIYGFGSANNGGGSDGEEFTFPGGSASAGTYIYISTSGSGEQAFIDYFGFAPDYTDNALSINGDDALELFKNGSVIDLFGDINVDGSGEAWEYLDGWAYRKSHTGPDGNTFDISNWTFSGPNAIDGDTTNATSSSPFPIGSYSRASFNCVFTCADTGDNVVTLTVADPSGNTASCDATVTVENNIAPTALCKQSVIISLDGNGMATVGIADIDSGSLDPCGIDTIFVNPSDFTCADTGTHVVTLTVTDASNNTSSCTSNVTIVDDASPSAVCNDLTVQLDSAGNATITATAVGAGSADNCGIASMSLSNTTYTCADVGTDTVTLTVTDAAGNSSTCDAIITIEDTVPPTAVCSDITVMLDPNTGEASITPGDIDGGSADDCGIASRTISDSSFTCGDIGSQTVTLTITDANGNVATCDATVTVADTTDPVAVCTDISIELGSNGTYTVSVFEIDDGSSDACGIVMFSLSQSTFDCSDTGSNTVTLTVMDPGGNLDSCTATVNVADNDPPTPVCVQGISVTLSPSGTVTLPASVIDNGSFDNCSIASLTLSPNTFTCADIGVNMVTLTATDPSGNSAFCNTFVNVQENIPPNAVCQDTTIQLDSTGNASITVGDVDGGSTDNCGIDTMTIDVSSFTCTEVGSNTVTLTVTDNSGNTSSCMATVTVEDNVAPEAVCQDATAYLDTSGNVTVDASILDGGSTDVCGIDTLTIAGGNSFDCSDLGPNSVTLVVEDVNGNIDTCSATLTIVDTIPPNAVCADISIQLDSSGNDTIVASDVDGGSTDACGVSGLSIDNSTFTCADVGNNTVTLSVTDGSGNVSTCQATVTVSDTIAPVALCTDITVQLNAAGNTTITPAMIDDGSIEACGPVTLSIDSSDFDCSDVGANTVTLTVTDASGNSSTCTATVTVEDNVPPAAICSSVTIQLDTAGTASTTVSALDGGSSDACGIDTITANQLNFDCGDLGNNNVILTVIDVNGNTSLCVATVTVQDTIDPTVSCVDTLVWYLDIFGFSVLTPDTLVTASDDNCSAPSLSISPSFVSCSSVPSTMITVTATDASGNTAMCSTTVLVYDTIKPTTNCDVTIKALDANGQAVLDVDDVDLFSFDACGLVNRTIDRTMFDCSDIGPNFVTLTVEDPSGNMASCVGTVNIIDDLPPMISCSNASVQLDANGEYPVDALSLVSSSSDNCGIESFSASPDTLTCAHVGNTVVTITATDSSGNSSTCNSNISVSDVTPPTAVCDTISVYLDSSGSATITEDDLDGGSSDACGIQSKALSENQFDCSDVGQQNVVTLFVLDVNSNLSSCDGLVNVYDTIGANAVCRDITVQLNQNGTKTIDASTLDDGSSDVCGDSLTFSASQTTFTCADLGMDTITLTVTDGSGNTSTCQSIVTVEDNINPVAICIQNLNVALDTTVDMAIVPAIEVDAGSYDNCSSLGNGLTLNLTPDTFDCGDLGVNNVILTVTDASGNSQNCLTTIEVQDNTGTCTPPPPACEAPANHMTTNVSYTTATLSYDPAPGASSYIIEGGVMGGSYIRLAFNGTSLQASNLMRGTTYEWRVYSVCNGDTSAPTALTTFTTLSCETPMNLNANVTSSSTATLSWDVVPGAIGYRVIGGVQGSSNYVTVDISGGSNTTLNASGLSGGTTYQWVVYAFCSTSPVIISGQSAINTFSTPPQHTLKAENYTREPISMVVYPNPNEGKFNIELFNLSEETTVEIFDLIGQEILTKEVTQEKMDIDMSDQERGTYLIRVTSGSETLVHRVIVQ